MCARPDSYEGSNNRDVIEAKDIRWNADVSDLLFYKRESKNRKRCTKLKNPSLPRLIFDFNTHTHAYNTLVYGYILHMHPYVFTYIHANTYAYVPSFSYFSSSFPLHSLLVTIFSFFLLCQEEAEAVDE